MGNLFKKKDIEPIKKVKVKMICNCGHPYCPCGCTATESTKYDTHSKESGQTSADICGIQNLSIWHSSDI